MELTLYRAAADGIVTDCASFAETEETARLYQTNPGFGGRLVFAASVTIDESKLLDLVDSDDAVAVVADAIGASHPGAIGADEYVPRVSYQLRDAGVEWVRVSESYPASTVTWIWVGGDEPDMEEI